MLKISVIAMGALLLAGFAIVIGRIVYLVNSGPPPTTAIAPSTGMAMVPSPIALPAGAVVRHIAFSGNRLAIHYDAAGRSAMYIVDLAGGPPVTLPIVADGQLPANTAPVAPAKQPVR